MDFLVNKLKVEEKLQLIDKLVSACDQNNKLISAPYQGIPKDASCNMEIDLLTRSSHCIYCGKKFQKLNQYYGHLKSHRGEASQWICQKCPGEVSPFKSLTYLRKHERSCHSTSQTFKCSYCEDSFLHASLQKDHEISAHPDHARFACQLCAKKYTKRSDLRSHLACHLSLKVNVCEVCGRSFSHISNLIRHSRLHSGVKPYPCNICGKRFTQLTSLNLHKISHHSDSPIICPALPITCAKVFRTPLTAKQHAFRAHPDVAWGDLVSTNQEKRQRKERAFFCRTCGEEFQKIRDLKIHISSMHIMFKDGSVKLDTTKLQSQVVSRTQSDFIHKSLVPHGENIQVEEYISGHEQVAKNVTESRQFALNSSTTFELKCTQSSEVNRRKWPVTQLDPGIICETPSPLEHELNREHCSTMEQVERTLRDMEVDLWHLEKYNFSTPKLDSDLQFKSFELIAPQRRSSCLKRMSEPDKDVEETSGNIDDLNHVGVAQVDLFCTEGEDGESFGDILQRKVNEMDSTGIVLDVNYGLCLDSCPETLPDQEVITSMTPDISADLCEQLDCSGSNQLEDLENNHIHVYSDGFRIRNMAEALLKCTDSTSDENFDILPNQLEQIKRSAEPENPETLILSYGESYTGLLKEMGISEDTTDMTECEEKIYNTFALDNLCTEPLLSTWDSYSVSLEDINIPDAKKLHEKAGFSAGNINMQNDSLVQTRLPLSLSSEFVEDSSYEATRNRKHCWYQLTTTKVSPSHTNEPETSPIGESANIQLMILETNQSSKPTDARKSQGKPLCSKEIPRVESEQNHKILKREANMSKNKCPECGKVFLKSTNLSQHLGLHFPNMRYYECTICNQTFSWKSSLNKHAAAHTLPQFLCDMCGKQYKSFNQIQQHKKRDHDGIRPNTCGICNKSYFRKHDLKIHERIHTNKKPYMCDECGKTFNHLSHLKRHKNVTCTG